MHITLEDPDNGERSVMCLERKSNHCRIIELNPDHLAHLEEMARSLGASHVTLEIILSPGMIEEPLPTGYKEVVARRLVRKEL